MGKPAVDLQSNRQPVFFVFGAVVIKNCSKEDFLLLLPLFEST